MKTAISIPDPLFESAELLAKRLHVSRSELYATALRLFVEQNGDAETRRALDALYAGEDSSLPRGARGAQARVVSDWNE